MASGLNKTVIKCIINTRGRFIYGLSAIYYFEPIDKNKTLHYIFDIIYGNIIEYDNNHIYMHCCHLNRYVDMDFNLLPNKEQFSKYVFEQIQKIINTMSVRIRYVGPADDMVMSLFVKKYMLVHNLHAMCLDEIELSP